MVLCKVQYPDTNLDSSNVYKTIAPLRRVEYTDLEMFISYLTNRLGILIDSYNPQSVNKIIFTYIVKKGKITSED
jgi:hypothetical protein